MTDRPLFRSVDEALRWAFKTGLRELPEANGRVAQPAQSVYAATNVTGIYRMGKSNNRDTAKTPEEEKIGARIFYNDPGLERKPTGDDFAAQRGMLQGFARRQAVPRCLHLLAKYAHGEDRSAAKRALREFLLPLLRQSVKPRYVIYQLVSRYYGKRDIVFKELAFKMVHHIERVDGDTDEKMHRKAWGQVKSLSREVDSWLKQVGTQTEEHAHEQLKQMGVIG